MSIARLNINLISNILSTKDRIGFTDEIVSIRELF